MTSFVRLFINSLLVVLLSASWLNAIEIPADQYNFPLQNRYLSTILSRAVNTEAQYETIKLEFRHDRRKVPGLEGKSKIAITLFNHKGTTAPLVFVIAGTGGSATSGLSMKISSEIYNMGYNVVSLPDPLSQDYILAVSQSALPGYPPRDSKEYYEFLKQVTVELKKNPDLHYSSYTLVGYSYGAILAGFLMREDLLQNTFNFTKGVLINPALDLTYGVKVLDAYHESAKADSNPRKVIVGLTLLSLLQLVKTGTDPRRAVETVSDYKISDEEMQWMIGKAFRAKLTPIVFASQQVNDLGILATKNKTNTHRRKKEAAQVSFAQYMSDFVLPSLKSDTFNMNDGNFYALADSMKNDSRVFVMENADDILVGTGDLDFLRSTLGDRLYLYPYGGHVGNISFARNRLDLQSILKQ